MQHPFSRPRPSRLSRRAVLAGLSLPLLSPVAGRAQSPQAAPRLPIFDSHLHYSHDAWDVLPPDRAIALLRAAGLKAAMVSSSSDEGTQKLHALAPDLVIPVLRPYRRRGELSTWVRDATVIDHLKQRLARHRYVALGEYHVYGADADLPVVREVVALGRQHGLFLHSHSDADAIERQFAQDPQARILWAHSGFDAPEVVGRMLQRHPRLWCDLAFRSDHAQGAQVEPAWRALFMAHPERFMVGTDTFTPERWHFVGEHADWCRQWLASLPADLAERIGWRNGMALFGGGLGAGRG